jgi:hypothetical protein
MLTLNLGEAMRRREFITLRYRTTPVNIIHENENAEYR